MQHVRDLLAELPLPDAPAGEGARELSRPEWVHDLGADLPAGHLHLWGGPPGAGKTSFLLSLLYAAALSGRRALFATYHLPASSVALRLAAMAMRLDAEALATGRLLPAHARRAASVCRALSRLPLWVLEARGLSVASIEDRCVRMPLRADVLAVDYLQAVVRPAGQEVGSTVRSLSSLASRLHVAVLVALQGTGEAPMDVCRLADRAGWIAPAGGSGLRRASVIRNRHGERPAVPLRLDASSGALRRVTLPEAPPPLPPPEERGADR